MKITAFTKSDYYVVTTSSTNFLPQCHEKLVSGIGFSTAHSEEVARNRAFAVGSACIYCNQTKLTTFVTLTYCEQTKDYHMILNDLKNLFSRNNVSYIAVVERHKSGNLHIHAICSNLPGIVSLRPGKYSTSAWHKGFSDVKFISGVDDRFRVESYIFKYITKAEKVGGRYILKSRDMVVKKFSYPYGSLPKPIIECRSVDKRTAYVYNADRLTIITEKCYYAPRNKTDQL